MKLKKGVQMNKQKLSTALKVARAKKDMKQSDLAKASGVALITIAKIEAKNLNYMPSVKTLVLLADALGINVDTLTKYL